jgi:hypothetical protein
LPGAWAQDRPALEVVMEPLSPRHSAHLPSPAGEPDKVLSAKPTSAARTTLNRIMRLLDTNRLGTVDGGVIMKLILAR